MKRVMVITAKTLEQATIKLEQLKLVFGEPLQHECRAETEFYYYPYPNYQSVPHSRDEFSTDPVAVVIAVFEV